MTASMGPGSKPSSEHIDCLGLKGDGGPEENQRRSTVYKRALRKMDVRVIPMLAVLYLMSFLDRGSIGNAKILGMEEELRLLGSEYNMCLTVFFLTYCAFEVPSNLLLKKLSPSVWLPSIMLAWGICTMCQGFVNNYHSLLTVRIFLGISESGLYPGVAFYLTTWYCPDKLAFRQGLFFSAASLAGAFSGLLAYGLNKMDGIAGYAGWRWIFIIEGLLTIAVAAVAYFLIHNSPEKATFLTDDEKAAVLQSLQAQFSPEDRAVSENDSLKWHHVGLAFKDWKLWLGLFSYFGVSTPVYGMSLFLPTIVHQLGYSATNAQLLMIPIYAAASACTVLLCYYSDRRQSRGNFYIALQLTAMTGFVLAIVGSVVGNVPGLVYAGALILTCAVYPSFVIIVSWTANNLAPSYKRATGMAMVIGCGNLGGAMASNFYRDQDSPRFILGHALELGFITIGLVAAIVLKLVYSRINAAREAICQEEETVGGGVEHEAYGDQAISFRYRL